MQVDRRFVRTLNGLCALVAIAAVGTMGAIAYLRHRTFRPPPTNPSIRRFRTHLLSGRDLEKQGRWSEAADRFLLAIKERPRSKEAHLELAQAYDRIHNDHGAYEQYRIVYQSAVASPSPTADDPGQLLRYGDLALKTGHSDEARQIYGRVSGSLKGSESTNSLRSRAYVAAALRKYVPTAVLPGSPPPKLNRKALDDFHEAIKLDDSAAAHAGLAKYLTACGNLAGGKAEALITESRLKTYSDDQLPSLAALFVDLKMRDHAAALLKKGVASFDGRAGYAQYYLWMLLDLRLFDQVRTLAPRFERIGNLPKLLEYTSKAEKLMKKGNDAEAERAISTAKVYLYAKDYNPSPSPLPGIGGTAR